MCLLLAVSWAGGWFVFPTLGDDPVELQNLRKSFLENVALSTGDFDELDQNYLAALERLKESVADSGDLEAVLAVKGEIAAHEGSKDEFDEEKFLTRMSEGEALRSLQETYLDARARIATSDAEKVKEISGTYVAELESLIEALTRENRIEDALVVRNEKERIEATIAVDSQERATDSGRMQSADEESEPTRVRAYVVAKAAVEIFINGEELFLRMDNPDDESGVDGKSRFFDLRVGDTVVVRVRSVFVYRSVALAFEVPDEDRVIFFKPEDFKIVGVGNTIDASKIGTEQIEKATGGNLESTFPDSYWQKRWDAHRLDGGGFIKPESKGEWELWGAVVSEELLGRNS